MRENIVFEESQLINAELAQIGKDYITGCCVFIPMSQPF